LNHQVFFLGQKFFMDGFVTVWKKKGFCSVQNQRNHNLRKIEERKGRQNKKAKKKII